MSRYFLRKDVQNGLERDAIIQNLLLDLVPSGV